MSAAKEAQEEYVLVLKANTFHDIGNFQGFSGESRTYHALLDALKSATFLRRRQVEDDPTYKQIIPYVILRHADTVFTYRRGKLLHESRLFGCYSIGIGGHISTRDMDLFEVPYLSAMRREVLEEVDISTKYLDRVAGLINDDTNDVGRVHLGIVHVFSLAQPCVTPRERSINEAQFCPLEVLRKNQERYESWSQICIDNIYEIISET